MTEERQQFVPERYRNLSFNEALSLFLNDWYEDYASPEHKALYERMKLTHGYVKSDKLRAAEEQLRQTIEKLRETTSRWPDSD